MHYNNIIKILKNRRIELNLTQNDLSELSGIGLRTIKEIESSHGNPTLGTIIKLLDVMGLDIDIIVKEITKRK